MQDEPDTPQVAAELAAELAAEADGTSGGGIEGGRRSIGSEAAGQEVAAKVAKVEKAGWQAGNSMVAAEGLALPSS